MRTDIGYLFHCRTGDVWRGSVGVLRIPITRALITFVESRSVPASGLEKTIGCQQLRAGRPTGELLTGLVCAAPSSTASANHLELGYATTARRSQGRTVDTAHALIGATSTRESLYLSATPLRDASFLYVDTRPTPSGNPTTSQSRDPRVDEVLRAVLGRTRRETSAHAAMKGEFERAGHLIEAAIRQSDFAHSRRQAIPGQANVGVAAWGSRRKHTHTGFQRRAPDHLGAHRIAEYRTRASSPGRDENASFWCT